MAQSPTPPVPTLRVIDWGAAVRKAWGDAWSQPEIAYEWSNARKFEDSGANGGPYDQG